MIPAEDYGLKTTLDCMLRSLHAGIRQEDVEAIQGLTRNIEYLLKQTAERAMPYNAFQITAGVAVDRKDLPGVGRETHRPHLYIQNIEMLADAGIARLDIVLPLPLEFGDDGLPYAMSVKTYPVGSGVRVSGVTINLGDTVPHHVFLYATEIVGLSFGHAVQLEYAPLLKVVK